MEEYTRGIALAIGITLAIFVVSVLLAGAIWFLIWSGDYLFSMFEGTTRIICIILYCLSVLGGILGIIDILAKTKKSDKE